MKAHAANLQHRAVHGPSRDPKLTRQAAAVDCRSWICRKPSFDLADNVKALLKRTRAFVQLHIKGSIAGLDLNEFFLLLSSTGLGYRRCELARIDGEQIGARFLQPSRKKATSSLSKRQHAESEH
jgi:hypothetical protein